jgi:thiamine biosynthesis protein ThiS
LGGKFSPRALVGERLMSITVNGRTVEWIENETVAQLLKRMKYTFPLIIVKIDKKIIPRKDHQNCMIPDESVVDVIHMISGG